MGCSLRASRVSGESLLRRRIMLRTVKQSVKCFVLWLQNKIKKGKSMVSKSLSSKLCF